MCVCVCVSQDKDNYNANNNTKCNCNCFKGILTLGTVALYLSTSAIVLSPTDRYHRIITEATEDNGGIFSFTHKLQYRFINKIRTRPIVSLNVL